MRNGEMARQGEVLIRLDDTAVRANLDIVRSQLDEAWARQARLATEAGRLRAGSVSPQNGNSETTSAFAQEELRLSRQAALEARDAGLDQLIVQNEHLIEGLDVQEQAGVSKREIIEQEIAGLEGLLSAKLIEAPRVNALLKERMDLNGGLGRIAADRAGALAKIAEINAQRLQLADEFRSAVLEEQADVSEAIAELMQKKIAAEDRLARLEIRSPITGMVHESIVHTIGGVIGAGETLMRIVPQQNDPLVDARVSPLDIDKLQIGQAGFVRLSSLDVRVSPDLVANVRAISPDLTRDPVSGAEFYLVRLAIEGDDIARLPAGMRLVPGMPAEVFMQLGDRTVLEYFVHPISEQFKRSFRED